LTLGRAVAGASARAKARRLGIAEERPSGEGSDDHRAQGHDRRAAPARTVRLLGREVPVAAAKGGAVLALDKDRPASPSAVQQVAVGTGLPVREPTHLRRLFADPLGRLEPGLGFERLAVAARATDPLPCGVQPSLPGSSAATVDGEAEEVLLARLLDRLGQRLRVHRPVPRASHWPERAVAAGGPFDRATASPGEGWAAPPWPLRPVRLLRRPVPLLAAGSPPPPGAPASLPRWGHGGLPYRVHAAEGPERIEPEWWRDRPDRPARDYWRVELASGARLWVCRVAPVAAPKGGGRWFLHGLFA
jgi:protein ImuB